MSAFDLDAFVERSRALVESAPPATRRETRAWLVDPLLETLGWDVHADACLADATVDGTRLEYVTAVDGIPGLFVAVEPYGESLEKDRAVDLLEAMAWTGIDRAIYTDGRDYLLLAGTTDVDRLACRLHELPDHESVLAHYTRETVGQRLERHARPYVARQLAVARDDLVASIVDELTSATDRSDAYRPEFESAADRFVDRLVAAFSDDRTRSAAGELEAGGETAVSFEFSDSSAPSSSDERAVGPTERSADDSAERSSTGSDGTDARSDADTGDGTDTDTDTPPDADTVRESESTANAADDARTDAASDGTADGDDADGGEYVVRFFNERGSIGAIGHSDSARALVGAAEYLFDRGLSGVSVPWRPDDAPDARAVLNDEPTHPDGTPMAAPQRLSNGLYLETAGDTDQRAARVEALVARAGLRAMLTGDWD